MHDIVSIAVAAIGGALGVKVARLVLTSKLFTFRLSFARPRSRSNKIE